MWFLLLRHEYEEERLAIHGAYGSLDLEPSLIGGGFDAVLFYISPLLFLVFRSGVIVKR